MTKTQKTPTKIVKSCQGEPKTQGTKLDLHVILNSPNNSGLEFPTSYKVFHKTGKQYLFELQKLERRIDNVKNEPINVNDFFESNPCKKSNDSNFIGTFNITLFNPSYLIMYITEPGKTDILAAAMFRRKNNTNIIGEPSRVDTIIVEMLCSKIKHGGFNLLQIIEQIAKLNNVKYILLEAVPDTESFYKKHCYYDNYNVLVNEDSDDDYSPPKPYLGRNVKEECSFDLVVSQKTVVSQEPINSCTMMGGKTKQNKPKKRRKTKRHKP